MEPSNRRGCAGGLLESGNLNVFKPAPDQILKILRERLVQPEGILLGTAEELEDPVCLGKPGEVTREQPSGRVPFFPRIERTETLE